MKNVLVTLPLEADQKTRLEQQLPNAVYTYSPAGDVTDGQIAAADIILGNLPPERVPLATHLEWMQLNSSGADAYAAPGVLAPGARLTNSTGAYGLAISEHLLAQTFFLKKKLGLYHRNQLNKRWQDEGRVTAIQDSTTLVVGLGSIGGADFLDRTGDAIPDGHPNHPADLDGRGVVDGPPAFPRGMPRKAERLSSTSMTSPRMNHGPDWAKRSITATARLWRRRTPGNTRRCTSSTMPCAPTKATSIGCLMVMVCTSRHRGSTKTVRSGGRRAKPRRRVSAPVAITQVPPKGAGPPSITRQEPAGRRRSPLLPLCN